MAERVLHVVDGTALVLRPWFAGVSNPNYVALRHLERAVEWVSHAAVVMDRSLDTFRRDIDPAYKAHRVPADAPLIAVFDQFEAEAEAMGVAVFGDVRFEADDLAATLARLAREQGLPTRVQAADKDLFQLVRDAPPALRVVDPSRGWDVDEEGVFARLGVRPDQVVDYLSLVGDASDGVRGVKGIGAKTATTLLDAMGSLDAIYADLEAVTRLPIRGASGLPAKLEAGREAAMLARRLVTLRDDVPLPADALERCAQGS
ncbi:MAG: flap endonuclease [Alphaproteobacteria bacterium]|nr:flap endonuclease [Alphaproteobacteria bacterium]MCB9792330.1 flap endonuclease [Alphaproteobacteria bacterium]